MQYVSVNNTDAGIMMCCKTWIMIWGVVKNVPTSGTRLHNLMPKNFVDSPWKQLPLKTGGTLYTRRRPLGGAPCFRGLKEKTINKLTRTLMACENAPLTLFSEFNIISSQSLAHLSKCINNPFYECNM